MMATINPSSRFMRLGTVWRFLALRSDVDDIILELLGRFSLEKLYSESDEEAYQRLVSTLLVQLNAIFYIQRLSLPSEGQQSAPYLGFIASWEVIVRSVEFVLQVIVEGREGLWEAHTLREKHLPEMLLSSLRVLALHPKPPGSQRVKDRRDRFSRIHSSLERLYDSYPGSKSFLLSVCREVTHSLLTEPSALALPLKLRCELPNLTAELYPLPDCLSSKYVSTIVPKSDHADRWLSLYLALRDVAQFVVAASVQYAVNGETRDAHLQSTSERTRNAILMSLDRLRMPLQLSKVELISSFSDIFQAILRDTPSLAQEKSSDSASDECEADALDSLCRSLCSRQILQRVSDRQMVHSISEVTRSISLLDDPSGRNRSTFPRAYTLNCRACHIAGDTQMKDLENLEFPDPGKGPEINLPEDTKCAVCNERVTVAREIPFIRRTWRLLKPLQPNAESANAERHLPDQFQLMPPRNDPGTLFSSPYVDLYGADDHEEFSTGPGPHFPLPHSKAGVQRPTAPGRMSPRASSALTQGRGSPRLESEPVASIDETSYAEHPVSTERSRNTSGAMGPPLQTPAGPDNPQVGRSQTQIDNAPTLSIRKRGNPIGLSVDRREKKEGKLKGAIHSILGVQKKDSLAPSAETSSISSNTLEQQKTENISLKALLTSGKAHGRGIHVYLSPYSTQALFWSQALIHIWDVGTSPPTFTRAISTESTCLIAAVTKSYLAYITGPREQKLTLRIINLSQTEARVAEYPMPSSQWCRCITINPHETYVVVGFDNSIVRFFQIGHSGEPREQRLLSRYQNDSPAIETLSFSRDGLVLISSMRSQKTGMIQVYAWKYPFLESSEVMGCRYHVPLHECEDNGVTSAIVRPKSQDDESLLCITTWTQSGDPILVRPGTGHKIDIRSMSSGHQRRLGTRIQAASFSPSGKQLAMVNDKGNLYEISKLNSSLMETKKLAISKELTAKSDAFAMAYMSLHDEESIVLAWTEPKGEGYVKKIPVVHSGEEHPSTTGDIARVPHSELPGDLKTVPAHPGAEMSQSQLSSSSQNPTGDGGAAARQSLTSKDGSKLWKAPVELAATDLSVSINTRKS